MQTPISFRIVKVSLNKMYDAIAVIMGIKLVNTLVLLTPSIFLQHMYKTYMKMKKEKCPVRLILSMLEKGC